MRARVSSLWPGMRKARERSLTKEFEDVRLNKGKILENGRQVFLNILISGLKQKQNYKTLY